MANNNPAVLTARDLAFVEKYVETMNATEAARAAGQKNPQVHGYQTLRRASIQSAILARRQQVAAAFKVTPSEVIRRIMLIGYTDPIELLSKESGRETELLPLHKLPVEMRLALKRIKVLKREVESEGGITVTTSIVQYDLLNKQLALDSLWDKLYAKPAGGASDDLSEEQLEELIRANEVAIQAIQGASKSSAKAIKRAVDKTSSLVLVEEDKPKGNGQKKGNGKGNSH